ncbi:hypothetical protein [Larkinella arboricola]
MNLTDQMTKPVPSDGPGFQRIVNEIDRYGRTAVANYAGVSYQTICNYIWEQKTSETTRCKIAQGLFRAAHADLLERKAEVLRRIDALQGIVDLIRSDLGTEFLADCQISTLGNGMIVN